MARRKRKKKQSMVGFWILEAIVVIAFAAVFFNAQSIRDEAMESQQEAKQYDVVASSQLVVTNEGNHRNEGWQQHRPRFSTVFGELWESGF